MESFLWEVVRDLRREADQLERLGLQSIAADKRAEADTLERVAEKADAERD